MFLDGPAKMIQHSVLFKVGMAGGHIEHYYFTIIEHRHHPDQHHCSFSHWNADLI